MRRSLSLGTINKIDKSGLLDILLDFPVQCKVAISIADKVSLPASFKDITKVVFLGSGGSAIGSDLVKSYLYFESKVSVSVIRDYDPPAYIDNNTLVFVVSYSGNTEETLSAYKSAVELGGKVIVVSSGGLLKECALRDKEVFIEVPPNIPPRCGLGYLSIIPLCILAKLGLIKDVRDEVIRLSSVLESLRDLNLNPHIGQKDNIAKHIAFRLYNRFPVIYAPSIYFEACAVRFKGQLNENSKVLASSNVFPEVSHNEIMGWQAERRILKNVSVIMFRDNFINPRISKRMDIVRDLIRKRGVEVNEIHSRGTELLSRIFSLVYIGDFISFYLAILRGIDPTPIDNINYLKQELAKGKLNS
ncbi:MAG: bifunctional phosphoglucose/phosphomannose isomerase [Candidatus Omnitrophica bacterium]|nr:bifunctional phosphoglucose/phosphomannose isomerase [Candidatus Omnitrophota bacterium]